MNDRLFPQHQTAIAPQTQNPIAYFPHQTAIAPSSPKTRSPKYQHQTAIALQPDRLSPQNQTAIAPHHP